MTIGKKLLGSFGAILLVTLTLGLIALNYIERLADSFEYSVNKTVRKVKLTADITCAVSDMLAGQRGFIQSTFGKQPENADRGREDFEAAAKVWADALTEIRPLLSTEEGKQLALELETHLTNWKAEFVEVRRVGLAGDPAAALKIAMEKGAPIRKAADKASQRIQELAGILLEKDKAAAVDLRSLSRWVVVGMLLLCVAVGVFGLFLVRQTTQTLRKASSELAEGAEQVTSAAGQVSSASQSLAQGSSEQAASLEETSASSEEMSSMTRKNAENSQQAAAFMNSVSQRVSEANTTLAQMMTSMQEISASSGKISKIIKVIDEIAFQTNILALNAAVEAARAGEAGMGFAVVADEVRNLAQRSAQAAKDTASLIEESISRSSEGGKKLEEVVSSIQAITEGAGKVKTLVDEVEASSKEQAQGIEQISKAVSQMDQVTQQNAANAEESASASEQLNAQAQALLDIVARLQALVGSASSSEGLATMAAAASSHRRPPITQRALKSAPRPPKTTPLALHDGEFREF